jgi:diguanylate cyclase (GGDEF)-like protein/PAS domain S-box-containing protein
MNSELYSTLPFGAPGSRAAVTTDPPTTWRAPDVLASTHGFAVLDRTGRFVAANPVFAATSGSSGDAIVGCRFDDVWTVDPEPGQPDELVDVLARVRREALVRVDVHPAGEPGSLRTVLTLSDLGGERGELGVTFVPAGQSVAPPEALMATLDHLAVAAVVYAVDGSIIAMNRPLRGLLGRSAEAMPRLDVLLTHAGDRHAGVHLALRALRGEIDGWTRDKRLVRPDGELVWVQESMKLVRDDRGAPGHFFAQLVDISASKASEAALEESRTQLTFFTDGLPVALVEMDPAGTITDDNAAARELLGHELVRRSLADVAHPEDLARVRRALVRADDPDRDWVLEFRARHADGGYRWVRAHARMHLDSRGSLIKAVSMWTDITDEVEAREASARFGELLESMDDMVALADLDGQLLHLNAAGRLLLPDYEMDLGGIALADLFLPESAAEITQVALPTARNFGMWKGEVTVIPTAMELRIVSLLLVCHVDERSGRQTLLAMAHDITELKRAEEAMRLQATTDPLTGLPNRPILFDRVGHALARCGRTGGGVALLFVDLDRFKEVNDALGHDAGDELLVQVAGRLAGAVRESDTVARLGGDEFVVLAEPVEQEEDASVVAHRIVATMAEPFQLHSGEVTIGASVGLALSDGSSTPRSLLKRADTAVYAAKASGRSCVRVAAPV